MSFIEINNLSFMYSDGTEALKNIFLNIEKGENIAIIGQNGAGKTTLVKMLNGLLKPTNGYVKVEEWDTKNYTVAQMSKKVGYVFQNPMVQIFHNNVYDEVAFAPKKLKYDNEKVKKITENALEMTHLLSYKNENPYNLPYSIRKFVTIASIIAMDTEVIIMDEPTAGQDLKGIKILNDLISELIKLGKTVITITHDMEFVVNNFDRVVVMAKKRIIGDGNKKEIFGQDELLIEGKVKRPYISDLAKSLFMNNEILSMEDFISEFFNRVKL